MGVITWRNIAAPNFAASNSLLESSNEAILKGAETLSGVGDIFTKRAERDNTELTENFANRIGSTNDEAGLREIQQQILNSKVANPDALVNLINPKYREPFLNRFISKNHVSPLLLKR